MVRVGIRELKDRLSGYLRSVKEGEEVIITERGRAIARIVREPSSEPAIWSSLAPLAAKGLIELPTRSLDRSATQPISLAGTSLTKIIIDDRR